MVIVAIHQERIFIVENPGNDKTKFAQNSSISLISYRSKRQAKLTTFLICFPRITSYGSEIWVKKIRATNLKHGLKEIRAMGLKHGSKKYELQYVPKTWVEEIRATDLKYGSKKYELWIWNIGSNKYELRNWNMGQGNTSYGSETWVKEIRATGLKHEMKLIQESDCRLRRSLKNGAMYFRQ